MNWASAATKTPRQGPFGGGLRWMFRELIGMATACPKPLNPRPSTKAIKMTTIIIEIKIIILIRYIPQGMSVGHSWRFEM